jgi:hypothetical protein
MNAWSLAAVSASLPLNVAESDRPNWRGRGQRSGGPEGRPGLRFQAELRLRLAPAFAWSRRGVRHWQARRRVAIM